MYCTLVAGSDPERWWLPKEMYFLLNLKFCLQVFIGKMSMDFEFYLLSYATLQGCAKDILRSHTAYISQLLSNGLLKPFIIKITCLIDAVKEFSSSYFKDLQHDAAGLFNLCRLVKGCNHCNPFGKSDGEDCPIPQVVCIPIMELYLALVMR